MGSIGIIKWEKGEITYEILRSARKTMALQVKPEGKVFVRIPVRMKEEAARGFAELNRDWIIKNYCNMKEHSPMRPEYSEEDIFIYRERAANVITARAQLYAGIMSVNFGRITIRQQKTRWGSCSAGGNLNFNWKLVLMPQKILDYVVVHELAHRRVMNHSADFWNIVEQVMPDYKECRKWLKEHGKEY